MKKLLLAGFAVGLMMFGTVAAANALTVDYTVSYYSGTWGTGSFTGNDTNADGFIKFNELSSFNGSSNVEGEVVNLSTLYDIGSFDIANNTWLSNGVGWEGHADDAFFTWNNRNNSVNSEWATLTTTENGAAPVPEPGTMMLLGAGFLGLAAFAKRRKNA